MARVAGACRVAERVGAVGTARRRDDRGARVARAVDSPRRARRRRPTSSSLAAAPSPSSSSSPRVLSETAAADVDADVDALRAHYAREGWVVVRGVVSRAVVDALQLATDALEASVADVTASTTRFGVFFEVQSRSGRKGEPARSPGALRKVSSPGKRHAAFARLTRDARVLEVVERVCGVRDGAKCVVHQDASFLKPLARERYESFGGANVVVAMDRSDPANGGFTVLGRTHEGGDMTRETRDSYDTSGDGEASVFDVSHLACETLEPGDGIFFHPLLAHGSGSNVSDRRRRIATLWYVGGEDRERGRRR